MTVRYKELHFTNKETEAQRVGKELGLYSTSNQWTLYLIEYGLWELDYKESWAPMNWCFSTVVLEKTFESPLDSYRKSVLNIHWKDWCWSWHSNTLATWCEELTHWKRPWSWERLKAGGKGDDRGWDGWMASPTQWTWVWVNSGIWWWTGRPGVLQSMGSRRVGHTEWMNWRRDCSRRS